jgi:aldehyde:ferredoxin oxidoreductase
MFISAKTAKYHCALGGTAMNAYARKILHVNLTTGQTQTRPLTDELAKEYLGGVGLGLHLLTETSVPQIAALDAQNPLVFALGPLTGTLGPTAGSGYAVVSKSPATGNAAQATDHSFFGPELKRAGYDAIVITGKAAKLSTLWIDDDKIQLIPAEQLKNASASQTQKAVRDELGDFYIRVLSIGQAGEKLCRFAAIVNDELCSFGRGGFGAVMGSKNLKAVAVRGTQDVNVADLAGFREFTKLILQRMEAPDESAAWNLSTLNSSSALATQNWTHSTFGGISKISGAYLKQNYVKRAAGCVACGLHCESIAAVPTGPYKGAVARLNFGAVSSFGSLCGIDQPDAIIEATQLTNWYGLDAVSTGAVVAFAMDLYGQGLLTKKQTDGIDLTFGNATALIAVIHKIGKREGWLGNTLAEGVAKAAEIIGGEASRYAVHVKGLEVAGYDLRGLKTAALAASVAFEGSCGLNVLSDLSGASNRFKLAQNSGKTVADHANFCNVAGSLIVCRYSSAVFGGGLAELAQYYTLATGTPTAPDTLLQVGERIETLARLFNIREGKGTRQDILPYKILNVPVSDEGPAKGAHISTDEFQSGLNGYYTARGWTNNGIPTPEKLSALNLTHFASILEGIN